MTEIMERMRKVLRDIGLYSGEGKIMAAELAAYGAGLSILFDAIDALRRNMFIGTADAAGLAAFERLFRITPSTDSVENRRAMLFERGSITAADHTRAALEAQLLAAGIRGNIVERFGDGIYVNVHEVLGISETAAAAEAADFLPAHLPCTLDFGRNTWDAVDARDMTFAQMDLKNRTWDEIDAM